MDASIRVEGRRSSCHTSATAQVWRVDASCRVSDACSAFYNYDHLRFERKNSREARARGRAGCSICSIPDLPHLSSNLDDRTPNKFTRIHLLTKPIDILQSAMRQNRTYQAPRSKV